MLTLIIRIHKICAVAAILAVATLASAVAQSQFVSPIVGTWITQQETEITIEPCDAGYCGFISKIVVPQEILDQYGAEQIAAFGEENFVDNFNPDPALRDRPILGLEMLTLVRQSGPVRYDGTVYNPQDGNTYDGFVEIIGPDSIRLSGCILYNTVCQGEDWTRAPFVVASDSEEAAAEAAPASDGG